jgi:hypothetical protein
MTIESTNIDLPLQPPLLISDVSDNEVKFCEDCQKWVKPPKCNHCGNEDLIPDWTY